MMSRSPSRIRYDVLAARVGEILHYVWDPIGVAGLPEARDEYDSYVPLVVKMLIEGKKEEEIAQHLFSIEEGNMGLAVGPMARSRLVEIAETLILNYQHLKETANIEGSVAP